MALFEAQVWVSGELPYQAEINASNVFQARKNIARREGVDEKYVNRVVQVQEQTSSSSPSFSSGGSSTGGALLIAALLLLGLIITYWYIVIPVAIILGILIYMGRNED
jgi:hypothetical protein